MTVAGLPEGIGNILSQDGKGNYRWLHETSLYRNPVYLFLIWKIFIIIWAGVALLILMISGLWRDPLDTISNLGPAMLYTGLFILVLFTFSYYIYALLMGGKYSVLFVMNSKGVSHTQLATQFKKAKKIAAIATVVGAVSGKPGVTGAGMLAMGGGSMYTEFKKVRSMKYNRRYCMIKLRSSDLTCNQIQTAPQDFDFVLKFIEERVPLNKKG
ncbi:MAG: hypothetical protein GX878_01735 [Firmicutes bacterium]|nr:hypothetical protein [Bacillota bacterium]